MNSREEIDKLIKAELVSYLRENGFKGSLPHFRRESENQIDLLSIQHTFPEGGKFVVEISKAPMEGIVTSWEKYIPPNKLKVGDVSDNVFINRPRLGSIPENSMNDHWFRYANLSKG